VVGHKLSVTINKHRDRDGRVGARSLVIWTCPGWQVAAWGRG
jgi:hypothetical protein